MLKQALLSISLLLPAAAGADGAAVKAGMAKKAPQPPAAAKRAEGKPAGAKSVPVRRNSVAARPAKTGQAAPANPRMEFLQQFADADDDGDGLLSRREAEKNLPDVAGKFDSADASSDGWLTPEELRSYIQVSRSSEPHG